MKIGYIVKAQAHTTKDTTYFMDVQSIGIDEDEKRELVRDACEYAWDHNDGWEWLRDGAVITLVINGVEHGDYPVDLESEPVFIVHKRQRVE